MANDYLAHYGILGMHWGIRRFQPYSVRGRKSGEGGKEEGRKNTACGFGAQRHMAVLKIGAAGRAVPRHTYRLRRPVP